MAAAPPLSPPLPPAPACGKTVTLLGFSTVWGPHHRAPAELERLRATGDDVADAALAQLVAAAPRSGGADVLEALLALSDEAGVCDSGQGGSGVSVSARAGAGADRAMHSDGCICNCKLQLSCPDRSTHTDDSMVGGRAVAAPPSTAGAVGGGEGGAQGGGGRTALRAALVAAEAGGADLSAARQLLAAVTAPPAWVCWEAVARGQAVFWRYCFHMLNALLHLSLIGGFGAPRITRVLAATGYLSGERVLRRLFETSQFVVDVMGSPAALRPAGAGWAAVLRVRFLHSRVRLRLLRGGLGAGGGGYDAAQDGVPINQEDLAVTLLSFSHATVVALQRLGVAMTPSDYADLMHVWRLVGWLMGVAPENNPLAGGRCAASGWFESVTYHLVQPDNELSRSMAQHLLRAVSNRPPYARPLAFHAEMCRVMLGDQWADAYCLPPSSAYWRAAIRCNVWLSRVMLAADDWVPGLATCRGALNRRLLMAAQGMMLGGRKVTFSGYGGEPPTSESQSAAKALAAQRRLGSECARTAQLLGWAATGVAVVAAATIGARWLLGGAWGMQAMLPG